MLCVCVFPFSNAVLVCSTRVQYVVIHSFRYIILNIEINIATTSDLLPFGCKLLYNRHRQNILLLSCCVCIFFVFSAHLFTFHFVACSHSQIFICFYRVDNCIRLVRFYRTIFMRRIGYHFINCMLLPVL